MACRGWLLVVGISCFILAAQGNSTSTVFTTTPTPTSTSTSTTAATQTQAPVSTASPRLMTTGPASTSPGSRSPSPTTATAPVTATTPTTTPTKPPTTTAPASTTTQPPPPKTTTPTTATATTTPTKPPTTTSPTTTTPSTLKTTTPATAAPTAPTTSPSSTTAITSTTSGTTLSPSSNTKSSAQASITSSTEPTSSESPTSTEASSATAETSTPSSTVSTASSVTTTVQPTTTSLAATSTSPPKTILLINNFTYSGLFSNGTNFTVEIKRLEGDAAPNMTVVVSDLKMKCADVVQVDSAAWNNSLAFKTATLTQANRRAVIVSLYTVQWTSCTDVNMSVVPTDATIVSQDPVNTMTTSIKFVTGYLSRILVAQVNRSIPQGSHLSVVRCDNTQGDPGSFIIALSKFNQSKSCDPDVVIKTITLNYTCDQWVYENTTKLINYFVKEVGSRCQCGFSPVYMKNATVNCTHTTTTTISWSIDRRFESEYDSVVNATDCMEIATSEELCLARTCHNCNNSKKWDPKHKGNISVTVGVVIACIVVFLIIVAIVILYIRKKRRGILQFRMTRLDEDDDDLMMSNDTDDFVGGQEASFSNSSYTRFK
ncbi:uncharacterized protein [Haliotis cracherodii]|uniref:uncharacterized protein n=1 Tax=Haliotis cracherodii TaxID=6455 RepID=UPI0039ECC815